MSVTALQASPPAALKSDATHATVSKSDDAAVLTARSSIAGVTLLLLAAAALPPTPTQGQQVDAQA